MLLSYFSALIATAGWIIYERHCPVMLKRYRNFSEFSELASRHDLEEELVKLLEYKYMNRKLHEVDLQDRVHLDEIMKKCLSAERRFQDDCTIESIVEVVTTVGVKPESAMILYYYLRSAYDKLFPAMQRVTYGCFLCAALLLLGVVGINTFKVIQSYL